MKKLLALILALCMVFAMTACTKKAEEDPNQKSEGVMTFDEYWAAAQYDQVVVETYVQGKESWWQDAAVVYTQDGTGAYFLYNLPCTQEQYDKLTVGTKIKVTGFKDAYSEMIEISPESFEIEEGSYVASPADYTSILANTDELAKHMGEYVTFKGLVVEPCEEVGGAPFMYNWDGSGEEGSDVYFYVSLNGQKYSFNVRSYLCGPETEVYKAAQALEVGQTIDVECFLYWYYGPQPRVTNIIVK